MLVNKESSQITYVNSYLKFMFNYEDVNNFKNYLFKEI